MPEICPAPHSVVAVAPLRAVRSNVLRDVGLTSHCDRGVVPGLWHVALDIKPDSIGVSGWECDPALLRCSYPLLGRVSEGVPRRGELLTQVIHNR
jgi:hypothetical protein